MNWTSLACTLAFLALTGTAVLLYVRRRVLDILDLKVISFGLTYGAGLLLTAVEPEWIVSRFTLQRPDGLLLGTTIAFSFLLVVIAIIFWRYLFPILRCHTTVDEHYRACIGVGVRDIILLAGIVVFIAAFGAWRYGLVGYVTSARVAGTMSQLLRHLPYWYTSLRQLTEFVLFALASVIGAKLGRAILKREHRAPLVVLAAAELLVAFVFGRRPVMYSLLALVFMAGFGSGRLFKARTVAALAMAFALMVTASNIYQFYRTRVGETTVVEALAHWSDVQGTTANLRVRAPDWAGGYLGLEAEELRGPALGAILMQDLKNSIPSVFVAEKTYVDVDAVLSRRYGFPMRDFPDTPAMELITDWGILPGLLVGLVAYLVGVLLPTAIGVSLLGGSDVLRALAYGGAGYLMINVEADFYTAVFTLWKYLAILLLLGAAERLWTMVVLRPSQRHSTRTWEVAARS